MSTVGTRGDVQPVLALALKARDEGHDVRLCVPPNFVHPAETLGFEARPLGIEMRAPRRGEGAPAPVPDLITDQFDVVVSSAEGCDLIVGGGAHQYAARSAAEIFGIPCLIAVYAPTAIPSVGLPPSGFPDPSGNPDENRRLWDEHRGAWNSRSLERVNANRRRWNLEPIDDVLTHILGQRPWLAADAALGPAPSGSEFDVFQPGAWITEDRRSLPAELSAFLNAGAPPVYFGLGSMPAPQSAVAIFTEAARKVGRRMILSRGWAELEAVEQGPDCLVIDEVNQQALFPRLAAVVHHGGAGTTTVAAKAGIPQIVLSMFGDQFYWGSRLHTLEVGVTLPLSSIAADSLSEALRHVLETETVARARTFARQISTDGVSVAARRLAEFAR